MPEEDPDVRAERDRRMGFDVSPEQHERMQKFMRDPTGMRDFSELMARRVAHHRQQEALQKATFNKAMEALAAQNARKEAARDAREAEQLNLNRKMAADTASNRKIAMWALVVAVLALIAAVVIPLSTSGGASPAQNGAVMTVARRPESPQTSLPPDATRASSTATQHSSPTTPR